MWPVFTLQFNFGLLKNNTEGVVHLIILFLHQFSTILHVFKCVRKLGIIPFWGMSHLVNVATTCLAIKFRVLIYYIGLIGPSIDLSFFLFLGILKYNFYPIVI